MIHFACTILYVRDVQKTINFYKKAFGFKMKFMTPKKNYGEVISNKTTIAFASMELARYNLNNGFIESTIFEKPFGIELVFSTDNVEKFMNKAKKAGAVEVEKSIIKPEAKGWIFKRFKWILNRG